MPIAEPPPSPDANLTTRLFVSPVGAVLVRSFADDPERTRLFLFSGAAPVVIAVLPVLIAHTNPPGPVACKAVCETASIACKITRLTVFVEGFQTPATAVTVLPSVPVV